MNGKSHVSGIDPTVIEDQDGSLADVLEAYLADLDHGAAPSREELLARHPGIAEQLTRCLDGLEVVWRTGAKFRDDSSDGAAQDANSVQVLDGPTGTELSSFEIPMDHRLTTGWSGDGALLMTCDGPDLLPWRVASRREFRIWSAGTGAEIGRFEIRDFGSAEWAPCDRLVAIVADQHVSIWDAGRAVRLSQFRDPQLYRSFKNIDWSPYGERIATSGWDGRINIWEARSGRLLQKLEGHATQFIRSVDWSSDGTLLTSGGWDRSIKIWNTINGRELHSLQGHSAKVFSVAFNPSASRLASSDWGGTIKLWDVTTGEELMTVEQGEGLKQLIWSASGHALWSHVARMPDGQGDPVWPESFEGHLIPFDAGRGYDMARSGELDAAVARRSLSAGLRFAQSGRVEESDRAFEDAEARIGPQASARRERAVRYLQRGMVVEAARDLEIAARGAPEEPAARNELAWLLANRNDGRVREPERSERIARELLAEWPEQGEFWTTLGLAQYRQGKWQEAIQSLQTASRLCLHRRARVHLILAMSQTRLGLTQQAEESMKQVDAFWDEFEFEQESGGPLTVDGTERLRDEAQQLIEGAGP